MLDIKKEFNALIILIKDKETEKFIDLFKNGCININYRCAFQAIYLISCPILFVAGYYRNMELMTLLINNGADINFSFFTNCTLTYELLGVMSYNNGFGKFSEYDVDDKIFIKFLLDNGANINFLLDNSAYMMLQELFRYCKIDVANLLLSHLPLSSNLSDNSQLLVFLSLNKNIKTDDKIELLHKLKIYYDDNDINYTILHLCCRKDEVDDFESVVQEIKQVKSDSKSAAKIKIA